MGAAAPRLVGDMRLFSSLILVPLRVQEFELTIDLETMLADMDREGTGGIDFAEFQSLLER